MNDFLCFDYNNRSLFGAVNIFELLTDFKKKKFGHFSEFLLDENDSEKFFFG